MNRVVNFRPLFFLFLALALGIASAKYIFSNNGFIIGVTIVVIVAIIVFSIVRKKWKQTLCVFLAFFIGIGAFFIEEKTFAPNNYEGQVCSVVGRVNENFKYSDDEKSIFIELTDVSINGKSDKNIVVIIYLYDENFVVETGNIISFSGEVYNKKLFENGVFNSYIYQNNTPYCAYADIESVEKSQGSLTLAETIRGYVKNVCNNFMKSDVATLAYSILFGDKADLDNQIKDNFATVGIAHLLAVSGLHIGFLVAILFWLLKKMRVVGIPRFIVIAVLLLFYSYLCDFTPSVVRASIMCLSFLFLGLLGRQNDLVNSIGLSGIIILIFAPMFIFNIGFLMSFGSVCAIAFLYKMFARWLTKIKVPNAIAEAVAIDITTTIAIAPILAVAFGRISLLSWLANLICIPLFSIGYSLLFCILFFVCIFNFLGFLLVIPQLVLQVVVIIANFIASATWAVIPLYTMSIVGVLLFYLILFIASPFVMTTYVKKCVAIIVAVCVGTTTLLVFNSPIVYKKFSYTQLNTNNPCVVMTSKGGEVLVVGDEVGLEQLDNYLNLMRIYKVDTFINISYTTDEFLEFGQKYSISNIIEFTNGLERFGDFDIQTIDKNNDFKAVFVRIEDTGFLIGCEVIGSVQASEIAESLSLYSIDVIFQSSKGYGYIQVNPNADYQLSKRVIPENETNYSTMVLGSFTFSFENGILGEIRSID